MKVLWTPRAAEDLEHAVLYISADRPGAATCVAASIYESINALAAFPNMGRIGVLPGTRELVFARWSYIAVYKVTADAVQILRIRHTSQDWP
jgi:toxin ParE1/3/4